MSDDFDDFLNGNDDICANKHGGNLESQEAFLKIKNRRNEQHQRIIGYLTLHPGLICEELETALRLQRSTISARVSELRKAGIVVPIGRAPTKSGCSASRLYINTVAGVPV